MPSTSAAVKSPLDIVVSFRAERSLTVVPEDPLRHYVGLIMLDESGAVGVDGPVIGEIEAMRLLSAEAEVEPGGLADVFDRYSDDLLAYYAPLRDARLFDDLFGDILIIDRIRIVPEWRRRGVGLAAIAAAIEELGRFCGLVAIMPAPTEPRGMSDEERAKGRRALARHWKQLGFKHVGRSDIWALDPTRRTWGTRVAKVTAALEETLSSGRL
jgi:GNAT superfamily N-acetyltransferase